MSPTSIDRAQFRRREACIACQSPDFTTLDSGKYIDEPVRGFIAKDPWGVDPLPFLQDQPWEFVQCKSCGQRFHTWLLTPEWQEVRFTRWMSESAIRAFERQRGRDAPGAKFRQGVSFIKHILQIEKMTRAIRGNDPVRVLDFGCGWGEFLAIAGHFGFEACGVDRSVDRQRITADRGGRIFADLDQAAASAGGGFYAVTLFQVLEHIEEPLELLIAIHNRMAPGGILILEVPNCHGIKGIHSASDYYNIHPLEHINCFTPRSLSALAKRAGFESSRPPYAQVTADAWDVLKGEAKRVARKLKPRSTNQYFRR